MSKYFTLSSGLRGCYMPDNEPFVARVDTRRELKDLIAAEAQVMREGYGFGGSKEAVATFAAECWREAHKPHPAMLPFCLPFGNKPGAYPFGLFVSVATRGEFLEYVKQHEEDL